MKTEKKFKSYLFRIVLRGEGRSKDEAWNDAVEAFIADPGWYVESEVMQEKLK